MKQIHGGAKAYPHDAVQFLAAGQRRLSPWHPRVLFDRLPGTNDHYLIPTIPDRLSTYGIPQIAGRIAAATGVRLLARCGVTANQVTTLACAVSVGLGLARADEPFHLERTVRGPQWLDLASAWLGAEHAQDARAVNDARIVGFPLKSLRSLLMRQPALQERLLVALAGTPYTDPALRP